MIISCFCFVYLFLDQILYDQFQVLQKNKKDQSNNSTSSEEEVNLLNYIDIIEKVMIGFYGAVAGLALSGFIFSWTVCCQISKTRKFMYFFCGFLSLIMIIGFILLTAIGFVIPNMTSTCIYMDSKMGSRDGTYDLLLDLKYPEKSANIYASCLHQSYYKNIISTLDEDLSSYYQKIIRTVKYSNFTEQLFPYISHYTIQQLRTKLQTTINQVRQGKFNQFQDPKAKEFFTNITQKNFPVNSNCVNAPNVYADSWVPSYSSQIKCMSGAVERSPCQYLGNMTDCPTGCYQIHNQFNKSIDTESNLNARYGPPGCNYYDYLIDLKKKNGQINLQYLNDLRSLFADAAQLFQYVVVNKTNEVISLVNDRCSNLLNTQKGSLFHSDCKIIAEETKSIKTSVCGLLKTLEYHFIFLCMICYSTLFVMCFTVCAGIRNYKSEGQSKVANDFGRQIVRNRSDSKIKVQQLEGSLEGSVVEFE